MNAQITSFSSTFGVKAVLPGPEKLNNMIWKKIALENYFNAGRRNHMLSCQRNYSHWCKLGACEHNSKAQHKSVFDRLQLQRRSIFDHVEVKNTEADWNNSNFESREASAAHGPAQQDAKCYQCLRSDHLRRNCCFQIRCRNCYKEGTYFAILQGQ